MSIFINIFLISIFLGAICFRCWISYWTNKLPSKFTKIKINKSIKTEIKPFDFGNKLLLALECSDGNYEVIKAKIFSGPYFDKAVQHLAKMLHQYPDSDAFYISQWETLINDKRLYEVFCQEFLKMLQLLQIRAEITDRAFIKVDRISLVAYKEQLLLKDIK